MVRIATESLSAVGSVLIKNIDDLHKVDELAKIVVRTV